MEDKLTKNDIELYLREINKKLEEQNKYGEIILTGGAALTLVYDARDSTKDIDALFEPSKDMRDIIISISEKYNLNKDWLNDGVKGFMQPSMKIETIQKYGNLTVNSLDAESLLAMKLAAARNEIGIKDKEDAVTLMKHLKIEKEEQLFDIVEKYVPKDKQTPKVYYFTQEAFNEYQKHHNFQKNSFESKELYVISQAPNIKDLPKKPDAKTIFNAYAKEVLAETGQKWTDKTNQLIAEKMMKNNISSEQAKRALKHSPEKIDKLNSFVSKIENQPEIKAILKNSRGMER